MKAEHLAGVVVGIAAVGLVVTVGLGLWVLSGVGEEGQDASSPRSVDQPAAGDRETASGTPPESAKGDEPGRTKADLSVSHASLPLDPQGDDCDLDIGRPRFRKLRVGGKMAQADALLGAPDETLDGARKVYHKWGLTVYGHRYHAGIVGGFELDLAKADESPKVSHGITRNMAQPSLRKALGPPRAIHSAEAGQPDVTNWCYQTAEGHHVRVEFAPSGKAINAIRCGPVGQVCAICAREAALAMALPQYQGASSKPDQQLAQGDRVRLRVSYDGRQYDVLGKVVATRADQAQIEVTDYESPPGLTLWWTIHDQHAKLHSKIWVGRHELVRR